MSDFTPLREGVDHLARRAPLPEFGDLKRRASRRRRTRRVAIGAAVVASVIVASPLALTTLADQRAVPADQPNPTPSVTETEFPMLPSGVDGSTPVTGNPQLLFTSWVGGGRDEVAMYPDGLVVWQSGSGYVQLRLTPAGVASIRSAVISTGLFDQDDDGVGLVTSVSTVSSSQLTIDRGSGLVTVQWTEGPSRGERGFVQASPSQERDLAAVESLLYDPSTWSLSSDMYADPDIKPFWGRYWLSYDRSAPDLTRLPEPVGRLVARLSSTGCGPTFGVKATRELLDSLVQAGFKPEGNDPFAVGFNVPGTSGRSFLHVHPSLPITCGYPE